MSEEVKEDEYKKERKVVIIVCVVAVVVSVVILLLVLFTGVFGKNTTNNGEQKEPKWFDVPYSQENIPTYYEVDEIMERAVEDLYGEDFWDSGTTDDLIQIPGTQITMTYEGITDNRDLIALTVSALQHNPYAISSVLPAEYQRMANIPGGSLRELPDGTPIDLAGLEEKYTRTSTNHNRNNPLHVSLTGYRNGSWFEDIVDLTPFYASYY